MWRATGERALYIVIIYPHQSPRGGGLAGPKSTRPCTQIVDHRGLRTDIGWLYIGLSLVGMVKTEPIRLAAAMYG